MSEAELKESLAEVRLLLGKGTLPKAFLKMAQGKKVKPTHMKVQYEEEKEEEETSVESQNDSPE